uniref:Uncharacterized protein n=1 Tax=viral metagenome TaxID=1070528 RepID=A0A6M3IPW2_9ZZZZ
MSRGIARLLPRHESLPERDEDGADVLEFGEVEGIVVYGESPGPTGTTAEIIWLPPDACCWAW